MTAPFSVVTVDRDEARSAARHALPADDRPAPYETADQPPGPVRTVAMPCEDPWCWPQAHTHPVEVRR